MLTLLQLLLPEIATHLRMASADRRHRRSAGRSCRPRLPSIPAGLDRRQNLNPVKIAAATHMAGAYNLKKVLPRYVLQRRQPPQINLPSGTLE